MGLFQLTARSLFKSDRDYTLHLTKLCFLPASNLYLTKEENSSKQLHAGTVKMMKKYMLKIGREWPVLGRPDRVHQPQPQPDVES